MLISFLPSKHFSQCDKIQMILIEKNACFGRNSSILKCIKEFKFYDGNFLCVESNPLIYLDTTYIVKLGLKGLNKNARKTDFEIILK